MLTKQIIGEYITINPNGIIQQLTVEAIFEDGIELVRTNIISVLAPTTDISTLSGLPQQIAALVWTPDVVQTFRDTEIKNVSQAILSITKITS